MSKWTPLTKKYPEAMLPVLVTLDQYDFQGELHPIRVVMMLEWDYNEWRHSDGEVLDEEHRKPLSWRKAPKADYDTPTP